jgi:hypothetical protein
MIGLPRLASGFVRLELRLSALREMTPGEIVRAAGVPAEELGHILVQGPVVLVDVRQAAMHQASRGLSHLGSVRVLDWNWRWLRLAVGRNHGLTIGQFKKVMAQVDALPLGRIAINNSHTFVGIVDHKVAGVIERLGAQRINGYAVRPEQVAKGPGSPAFTPGGD